MGDDIAGFCNICSTPRRSTFPASIPAEDRTRTSLAHTCHRILSHHHHHLPYSRHLRKVYHLLSTSNLQFPMRTAPLPFFSLDLSRSRIPSRCTSAPAQTHARTCVGWASFHCQERIYSPPPGLVRAYLKGRIHDQPFLTFQCSADDMIMHLFICCCCFSRGGGLFNSFSVMAMAMAECSKTDGGIK